MSADLKDVTPLVWHVGRSWSGHPLEDDCPCPKASCGLVVQGNALDTCPQHAAAKTIRQGHPSENCPGTPHAPLSVFEHLGVVGSADSPPESGEGE